MQFFKTNNPNTHFCFFSSLTPSQVEQLKLEEINKSFKKGETIFREGSYPNALYVVYRGIVKLHKYGDNGKEQIIRFAQGGDLLGYRSLISGQPYAATATAVEETKLFKIPRDTFFNLVKDNHDFALKIMKLLSTDLQEAEKKLVYMAQKSVREKVAEALLVLNNTFGLDNDNVINAKLTRKEIGDMAGVTTESTIRTISDFNKENLIKIDGRKIIINDLEKLKREIKNKIA